MDNFPFAVMCFITGLFTLCSAGIIISGASILGVFGTVAMAVICLLIATGLGYLANDLRD